MIWDMEHHFGHEDVDPARPSERLLAELQLRARWLESLCEADRAELVNMPIAAVEGAFARWRERAGATDGTEVAPAS